MIHRLTPGDQKVIVDGKQRILRVICLDVKDGQGDEQHQGLIPSSLCGIDQSDAGSSNLQQGSQGCIGLSIASSCNHTKGDPFGAPGPRESTWTVDAVVEKMEFVWHEQIDKHGKKIWKSTDAQKQHQLEHAFKRYYENPEKECYASLFLPAPSIAHLGSLAWPNQLPIILSITWNAKDVYMWVFAT